MISPAIEIEGCETVAERIARLGITDITPGGKREAMLATAHPLVDDATFRALGDASRASRMASVIIPAHHYEGLSRGRGWCRQGRGSEARWGERTDGGYRVGPGKWTAFGSDGFRREGRDEWTVRHVSVGTETWTVAS